VPPTDDEDRAAILERRRRWLALALAGAAATATSGCPRPCLSPPNDAGTDTSVDAGTDADDHD
jgi:hypothetical protein